jgi:hypothetical protein
LNGGDASADSDVFSVCGGSSELRSGVNSVGDEMECGVALHCDGSACVVRQHEDLSVVWRIFAPPSFPVFIGPWAADGTEHVAAHNPCSDIVEAADGEIVVNAGGAVPVSVHALEGASGEEPIVQSHGADAERVFKALRRAGAVTVDGNAEGVDSDFGHGVMLREILFGYSGMMKALGEFDKWKREAEQLKKVPTKTEGFRGPG